MTLQQRYAPIQAAAAKKAAELKLQDHTQGLGLSTKRDHSLPDPTEANKAAYKVSGQVRHAGPIHESIDEAFTSIPDEVNDKLDAIHAANADINVLRVTESGEHDITVQLPNNSYTHTVLHVPSHVTASIKLIYETATHGFSTEFIDIVVDEHATADITDVRQGHPEHILYSRREAVLHDHATLRWTQCDTGSKLLTNFTKTHLLGDHSESRTTNLFYGSNGKEFDVSLESHHTGEQTYSFIRSRGALRSAKSTQRGLVRINKPAFDADGYQKADNLLLDDDANAVSIPDLEIHNPEVQCSHGSTVSSLDDDQLFYLETRGYDDLNAKKTLIEGFYNPYIERVKPESAQDLLRERLINNIHDDLHDAH